MVTISAYPEPSSVKGRFCKYYLLFIDEGTKPQRVYATCPRSHSKSFLETGTTFLRFNLFFFVPSPFLL